MTEKKLNLRSAFSQTLGDEVFHGREEFDGGLLPTERDAIEMMIWVLAPRKGTPQPSMNEAAKVVSEILHEHWIWSNVYPKKIQNIHNQVQKLFLEFKKLRSTPKVKQTETWRKERLMPFLEKIKKGINIGSSDQKYVMKMEEKYGVKMTEEDRVYMEDQVFGTRKMYCESFADKKWLSCMERRRKAAEYLAKAKKKDNEDQATLFTRMEVPEELAEDETAEISEKGDDEEDVFDENDEEDLQDTLKKGRKRRRTREKEKMTRSFADMPKDCQHIRHSIRQVRPEYYATVDELMSVYHMSYE